MIWAIISPAIIYNMKNPNTLPTPKDLLFSVELPPYFIPSPLLNSISINPEKSLFRLLNMQVLCQYTPHKKIIDTIEGMDIPDTRLYHWLGLTPRMMDIGLKLEHPKRNPLCTKISIMDYSGGYKPLIDFEDHNWGELSSFFGLPLYMVQHLFAFRIGSIYSVGKAIPIVLNNLSDLMEIRDE